MLFKLEDQDKIKSFKNASDDNGFEFILKVPRMTTFLGREELLKLLKLEARDTENLTVWNPDGVIEKYESVEKLLAAFVEWRLERYEERRAKQIEITEDLIKWLEEVVRFIEFYLARTQEFRNAGKKELLELLTSNAFTQPERLLGMSIWTLTKDNIDELLKKLEAERKKLQNLKTDTAPRMYRRELQSLSL
jgi:DNA gyrase/topoisomerase IV subunit A